MKLTEALVADVQVPQINAQVISRDVSLLVGVDRNRVYVVRVGVRVDFAGDGGDDAVLVGHAREAEVLNGGSLREVGFRHGPDLLLVHLP
jgi:hypothetical protein